MPRTHRNRAPSLVTLMVVVWCLGLAWSPSAYASPRVDLPGSPGAASGAVDGATGAVSGAVDGATGAVSGAVDGATQTVSGAVDEATQTVSGAIDPVAGAAGSVAGTVDEVVGGSAVGAVTEGVVDAVQGAVVVVEGAVDGADQLPEAVNEVIGGVTTTVDEVTDTVSGSTGGATDPLTDPIDDALDGAGQAVDGVTGGGGIAPPAAAGIGSTSSGQTRSSNDDGGDVGLQGTGSLAGEVGTARAGTGEIRHFDPSSPRRLELSHPVPDATQASQESPGGENAAPAAALDAFARTFSPAALALIEAARAQGSDLTSTTSPWARLLESELAKQVAFPMALALIVAGFVALHNKLDRDDPKLALAPVDQGQEVLYFE